MSQIYLWHWYSMEEVFDEEPWEEADHEWDGEIPLKPDDGRSWKVRYQKWTLKTYEDFLT